MLRLLGVASFLSCCCCPRPAQQPITKPDDLHSADDGPAALARLADAWWKLGLDHAPHRATIMGIRDRDHLLPDLSSAARERRRKLVQGMRSQLQRLSRARLSADERVTYRVLSWALQRQIELDDVCKRHYWPLDYLYGPQVWLPELPRHQTINTDKQLRDLLARYRGVDRYLASLQENIAAGAKRGMTSPRIVVDRVRQQLARQIALAKKGQSPMLVTAGKLPRSWTETRRQRVVSQVAAVVNARVLPALSRFLEYLTQYRLGAREAPGISANADGLACYRARIRYDTGSELRPRQIHEVGRKEIARLHREMQRISERLGGAGGSGFDLKSFIETLRQRPDMYVQLSAALVAAADRSLKRARSALGRAFGRLPQTPIKVIPMPAERARDAPAAYYFRAPTYGSRPAYMYLNTFDLGARPLYNLDALTFHEAIPGHHLQIALAAERRDIPEFRRFEAQTAFVEGWALYAEMLADELHLYSSAATRFGYLNYQAWRAARLVIDTGIHALGWSRQRAVAYLFANTALTRAESTKEVDRYINWPGQALAYMLGRMAFERLRARAEKALGQRFDLRAFHDELLRHGAVPLAVLSDLIARWIRRQSSQSSQPSQRRKTTRPRVTASRSLPSSSASSSSSRSKSCS